MQTPVSRTPFSISGFFGAALSAPGLAVFLCMVGVVAAALFTTDVTKEFGSLLFGLFLFFFVATIWGAVPSVVFGGLVLVVIQRIPWPRPPGGFVFVVGGVVAAGLYVLTALETARLSPGAAMLFAPWTAPELTEVGELRWVAVSIVLAGAGAGLIYAGCVKRG